MFRFIWSSVVFSLVLARAIVSAVKKTISSKVISITSIIEEKITYQKIKEFTNHNKHNIKQFYDACVIITLDKIIYYIVRSSLRVSLKLRS